jgi:ribosomal protein S18 acetylase RimI-like enzyme
MQRTAQARAYAVNHPNAGCDVVLVDAVPAGRLYVDRSNQRIHVLDISLVPERRGCGIGTHLLTALLDEAARTGVAVTLNVERSNRAFRLYRRLGFEVTREDEVYLDLAWTPPAGETATRAG